MSIPGLNRFRAVALFVFPVCFASISVWTHSARAAEASLKPAPESASDISSVYRDMIVVQRKAKQKAGRVVFGIAGFNEFGDGPISVSGVSINAGYAFLDSLEIGLSAVPVFLLRDRAIKTQVSALQLQNGQKAQLVAAEPKLQLALELLWLPAYGKDSWSPYSIVRSDTFFRLSLGTVQYQSDSGMRFGFGVGKTFFLSRFFNLRASGMFVLQDTVVNTQKTQSEAGVFELGAIWYL